MTSSAKRSSLNFNSKIPKLSRTRRRHEPLLESARMHLEKLGDDPSIPIVYSLCSASHIYETQDDWCDYIAMEQMEMAYFLYLQGKGLCSFEYESNCKSKIDSGDETRVSVKITWEGLDRVHLARKTGKPIRISEADDVVIGWARLWKYLLSLMDEFVKALVRYFVPALIAGVGAGLSAEWVSRVLH